MLERPGFGADPHTQDGMFAANPFGTSTDASRLS